MIHYVRFMPEMFRRLAEDITVSRRDFLRVFLPLLNTLTWFYVCMSAAIQVVSAETGGNLHLISLLNVFAALSAVVSGVVRLRLRGLANDLLILLEGFLTALIPLSIHLRVSALPLCYALSFMLGWELPGCFSLFGRQTRIEERGRIACFAFIPILFATFLVRLAFTSLEMILLAMAVWRLLYIPIFRFVGLPTTWRAEEPRRVFPMTVTLSYLSSWFMFGAIDRYSLLAITHTHGLNILNFMRTLSLCAGVVGALIGGFIVDLLGRRPSSLLGFVGLGIAYTLLSINPHGIGHLIVYSVLDGLTWGLLTLTYTFVVWGDLSPKRPVMERYYALGFAAYLLSSIPVDLLGEVLVEIPLNMAFSVSAFFLFLAVLPLWSAPETVPSEVFEHRRLRAYIRKAKRMKF